MTTNTQKLEAPKRLTLQQRRFGDEYIVDLNATQAAIRAGYSPKTAYSQGQRLLKNVEVQAYITKREKARAQRTEVTADNVILRLAQIAFTDISAFATWTEGAVKLRPLDEIPKEALAALQEVAETHDGLKIKMADRMPALTLLAKHLRLLPTPGSKEDPLHLKHTIEEAEFDLSKYTPEQLDQLGETIDALLAAQEITSGNTQQGD